MHPVDLGNGNPESVRKDAYEYSCEWNGMSRLFYDQKEAKSDGLTFEIKITNSSSVYSL